MPNDDHRPSYLQYWEAPSPLDPSWPAANPNWRKSEHAHGVGFFAPWEEVFAGFPEHARRNAVALDATGLAVHLRSCRGGMQFFASRDLEAARAYEQLKTDLAPLLNAEVKCYDAEIWQIISEDTSLFRIAGPTHHWLDPSEHAHVLSRRIIYTVFERDRVSEDAAQCLNRVAQVWVANDYDRQMLVRCGVSEERVRVVPMPYFPADPHLALNERKRLAGPVRFYHVGKWEPRKEHRNIIGAFLLAFEPGEAKLYIKTSTRGPVLSTDYPQSPAEATSRWLADPRVRDRGWTLEAFNRDVIIIQRRLTMAQMLQLHRQGDVYVTLSRGEGFDMPAFDAKLSGNLMVFTPSGGPQSFAGKHDVPVNRCGSVPCDPFYGWGEAEYIDYRLEDAIDALRYAKDRVERGERMRGIDLERHFSAAAVGSLMRRCVEEVCAT
jgi:glycosyltransferase involved in cell wall biosynthesis